MKAILLRFGRDLLMLALVVVAFALIFGSTRATTTRQCERTREFAPYLAGYYQRNHVLPPGALLVYRATIPTHC